MKNTTKNICSICHDVIETQHVFSEDNQVFIKKSRVGSPNGTILKDEWFPINFQWISDTELRKNIALQSNME
ncbi:MAG: hypothetical protein R2814_14890 [Flavobacteriaceae bacterium]